MRSLFLTCALGVSATLIACSGGRSDDGTDAGTEPDGGTIVEGVAPAALPVLTPCPEGWREVELAEGVAVCDPWPEGGPMDCGAGTAHFPGGGGCEAVGPACPEGEFATDLPSDRDVIYVSGGAGTGGSGTADDPFHDLFDAFAAASGGEVFALGVGTHTIEGVFPENTTFWGACTGGTRVVPGFADGVTGTVTAVEGARVELRNLWIGGPQPGVRVEESATVDAENVIIEGTGIAGIWATSGGTFAGRNVVVRDTVGADDGFGRAISAEMASTVEIERGAFERTREMAVQMVDEGSALRLVDVTIRGTRAQATDDGFGRAIEIGPGASAELRRVALESNLDTGVFAGGSGASVTIEDSVVRGHREIASSGEFGRGLHSQEGGTLDASRVWVEDNREIGVYGSGEGGVLTLRDVVVRGTRARSSDGAGGRGVQVQWGVHLDAERVLLADNTEDGLFVATDPTSARVVDLTVLDTRSNDVFGHGRGVQIILGATAELERIHLARNTDIGLFVHGSEATVTDLAVLDTRPNPGEDSYGRGVSVQQASRLSGSRVRVLDNREIGIHVSDSVLELSDVHVERTLAQACADTTCPRQGRGVGLSSIDGAEASLTDFTLADNALAGIFLGEGGTVTLTDGEVARHPIGIHTGSEELDFETRVHDVAFVDNDRNVDASVLPLPEASAPGQVEL